MNFRKKTIIILLLLAGVLAFPIFGAAIRAVVVALFGTALLGNWARCKSV